MSCCSSSIFTILDKSVGKTTQIVNALHQCQNLDFFLKWREENTNSGVGSDFGSSLRHWHFHKESCKPHWQSAFLHRNFCSPGKYNYWHYSLLQPCSSPVMPLSPNI